MASSLARTSASAPSSHSLISRHAVVCEQNATTQPVVTPESLMARRRSSVRSMNPRRLSASTSMFDVVDFTDPPPSSDPHRGRPGLGLPHLPTLPPRSGQWQDEAEPGSPTVVALSPDPAAVRLDHGSGDGETDPGPTVVARTGRVY